MARVMAWGETKGRKGRPARALGGEWDDGYSAQEGKRRRGKPTEWQCSQNRERDAKAWIGEKGGGLQYDREFGQGGPTNHTALKESEVVAKPGWGLRPNALPGPMGAGRAWGGARL